MGGRLSRPLDRDLLSQAHEFESMGPEKTFEIRANRFKISRPDSRD